MLRQVWERFDWASVHLFALHKNAQCPLFFSLRDWDALLGADALAHPWPNVLLYTFPPLCLITPTLIRVNEHRAAAITNPDSPSLAQQTMDGRADTADQRPAMAIAITRRLGVTGTRADFSSASRMNGSLCLVRERTNLQESLLRTRVVETIQCARAPSTHSLYDTKWRVFERWCGARDIILLLYPGCVVLPIIPIRWG